MKARIKTWKMGPQRYLHCLEVPGGWFHVVTDSDYFSMNSQTILRNKVLAHNSTKETRGLRLVREGVEDLGDKEWVKLCFWGNDNLELRKKIYGEELKKVMIKIEMYKGGRIDEIYARREQDSGYSKNLIYGHSVKILRDLNKRIRDPLPYIISEYAKVAPGEEIVTKIYTVSEVSYVLFLKKLKDWRW